MVKTLILRFFFFFFYAVECCGTARNACLYRTYDTRLRETGWQTNCSIGGGCVYLILLGAHLLRTRIRKSNNLRNYRAHFFFFFFKLFLSSTPFLRVRVRVYAVRMYIVYVCVTVLMCL